MTERFTVRSEQFDIYPPPDVWEVKYDQVYKMWLRCPECNQVHELWPQEMKELKDLSDYVLFERVLDCWLSHPWTPNSKEEAHEKGFIPESWLETTETKSTGSDLRD